MKRIYKNIDCKRKAELVHAVRTARTESEHTKALVPLALKIASTRLEEFVPFIDMVAMLEHKTAEYQYPLFDIASGSGDEMMTFFVGRKMCFLWNGKGLLKYVDGTFTFSNVGTAETQLEMCMRFGRFFDKYTERFYEIVALYEASELQKPPTQA